MHLCAADCKHNLHCAGGAKQRLCLVPTTKTPRTRGTEEILFISHQGRVQLGYADTFPMDGIVLLQYKFPLFIVRGCPWSCCSLPALAQQEQPSPKALSEHPSPQGEAPPSPQPAQAHTDLPNRAWQALPTQEFSTVVSLTTDLARHYSGVNIPVLYFAT